MNCKYCDTKRSKTKGSSVNNICSPAELLKDHGYKYCPKCGEPLTEPQSLTFEQLWERIGNPVYAVSMSVGRDGKPAGNWCILDCIHGRGEEKHIVAIYGLRMTLEMSDYGKTWLAYDRLPKERDSE